VMYGTGNRLFASPGRYLQGPTALDQLVQIVQAFGKHPILVMDAPVRELIGNRVLSQLTAAGLAPHVALFTGEITYANVEQLTESCRGLSSGVVVGLGGGKVLDTAKAISLRLGVPMVTVPTIASNDSPTSSVIAMYDEEHRLISVDKMVANPAAVIVDTSLIVGAPARFLRSGIGDALSKVFEADACRDGTGMTPLGTRPLGIASAIGQHCYQTLRADSVDALRDCEEHRVTDAVERVVEAVVLLSGLSFENGGLSLAHSLTRGLMATQGAKSLLHGYHVAWGAVVQLAAEGRPDTEVLDLMSFVRAVGLPASSEDLGIVAPVEPQHNVIAELTLAAPHLANFLIPVTQTLVVEAIQRVDRLAGQLSVS